jgi:predicted Mrr-cat superfamily restriction endonuclease
MESQVSKKKAFVLRIAPGRKDKVPLALEENDLIIRWAKAGGLLDESLSRETFREIVHKQYYSCDENFRRSGMATSFLWLFIRDMKPGDVVVVPHGSTFYVGEVNGHARYDLDQISNDAAYRRSVNWLNSKKPIKRKVARAALQSRMKIQGTCADATDLLDEISSSLVEKTTFEQDLHEVLVEQTIQEIRTGKMDGASFEQFIASLLVKLGGYDVRVIAHTQDKGADIIAQFRVAGTLTLTIAVQAKHYMPKPPVPKEVVETLLLGMEAENADIGMIVTSGTISSEAADYVQNLY